MPEEESTQALHKVPTDLPLITAQDDSDADAEAEAESLAFKSLLEMRRKKKRKKIIIGSAVGVVLLAVFGWILIGLLTPASKEDAPVIATSTAQGGGFIDQVNAKGSSQPKSSVVVTPEVDGIIESVNVQVGSVVNEGDLLFTLKNESLDKAISDAAAQVESAQTALDTAYAEQANAWDAYNATQGLDGQISDTEAMVKHWYNALTQVQIRLKTDPNNTKLQEEEREYTYNHDQAEASLTELKAKRDSASSLLTAAEAAASAVASAESGLTTAQNSYNEAVKNAQKREVRAPISGSVLVMNATEGAGVGGAKGGSNSSNNSSTELVRIADFSKISVSIQVNEVDISKIKTGQKATVTFSALPDVVCDATVESIATVATGSSSSDSGSSGVVTYTVELIIDDPNENIKPGMSANVSITTQEVADAITVPATALVANADGSYSVTVVTRDDKGEIASQETRQVSVAATNSTTAAISQGLSEGDEVLLANSSTTDDSSDDGLGSLEDSAV